jgi:hypothetical protein
LPQLRQYNAAAGPLEQASAAFLFEQADLAADMRLACAVGSSDFAQASELGGINEKLPSCVFYGNSLDIRQLVYLNFRFCVFRYVVCLDTVITGNRQLADSVEIQH